MTIAKHEIDGSQAALPDTMAGMLEAAIADARKLDPKVYFPNHL